MRQGSKGKSLMNVARRCLIASRVRLGVVAMRRPPTVPPAVALAEAKAAAMRPMPFGCA